jgi:hypothetical protein
MPAHTFARSRYGTDLLRRVAAGWRRLADDQRRGVVSAARIAADLACLDAPPALLMTAGQVIQEEIRHLEVCARVLEELDPNLRGLRDEPPAAEPGLPRASISSERSLARTLVADYALGKPASAAAFAAARAVIREPLLAWAYTELLHDETRHATFGARAAVWVIRRWSALEREALWTACLVAPGPGLGLGLGGSGSSPTSDPEAEALGLLPAEVDWALPRWILPHLEPLGLHPRAANDQGLLH